MMVHHQRSGHGLVIRDRITWAAFFRFQAREEINGRLGPLLGGNQRTVPFELTRPAAALA